MKFIDKAEIKVHAGKGGDGMVCFKQARNKPNLGPDGGNGGNGADVVLLANRNLNTLSAVRFRQVFSADDGGKGGSNNKTGKCGDTLYIDLPFGTVVFDKETGLKLGELLPESDSLLVCQGGKRGLGNRHFITPTRQAPHFATSGQPGESRFLALELKLLADIGLAGFPNAGKSTLLSKISSAKPKIAAYPFTTLTPNLGVVDVEDYSYVVTDVPGLIEGAHIGKGLGHHFLKHLERTRLIAYVLDGFPETEGESIVDGYRKISKELELYSPDLAKKARLVILNKIDMLTEQELSDAKSLLEKEGLTVLPISALNGKGVELLKIKLAQYLQEEKEKEEKKGETHGFGSY